MDRKVLLFVPAYGNFQDITQSYIQSNV